MHYLITGHTGFKGAWLALVLHAQGHQVSGIALEPRAGSLFLAARVHDLLVRDVRVDIRDESATTRALREIQPDVVIHMAAQALVRESYRDPRTTFTTNVLGTLNLLEAVAQTPSVHAHVIVTTDKVYRNLDQSAGYTEDDALGAGDPYSSSKAMADILAQSWMASFDGPPTAIARAGNVIGGGDDSPDRLVPDLIRSFSKGEAPVLRYPGAVRPWQHVLDCLDGYLLLSRALLDGRGSGAWNFGPGRESFVTVGEVATAAAEMWGAGQSWEKSAHVHEHEANLLALDSGKAQRELHWVNRLRYPSSLKAVIDWHRDVGGGGDPLAVTMSQVRRYGANGDESP